MFNRSLILMAACAPVLACVSARAAVAVDGTRDADYGPALSLQTVTTGFGDNSDPSGSSNNGSELDAAYAVIQGGNLNLLLTGNFQNNGNHLNLFFSDGSSAGQSVLSTASGSSLAPMNGSKFSSGFKATYALDINDFADTVYVNQYTLTSSNAASSYYGNFAPNNGQATALHGLNFSLNNTNVAGVAGGNTPAAADQTAAGAVQTGIEISLPLSLFSSASGTISMLAAINGGGNGYLSNQFLAGLGTTTGNVGGVSNGSFDFSATPNMFFTIGLPVTGSVNGVWNSSAGGSWNSTTNWSGGVPKVAADRANFGSAITGAATVTLDGSKTVGQIVFNNANRYTIAQGSGGTLTIDDTGDTLGVNPAISVQLGDHTISAPVALTSGVTVSTTDNTSLTMSGTLSGAGDITHTGNGALKLAHANSFTGNLVSTGGTVELDANGAASSAVITLGDPDVDNQAAALSIGAAGVTLANAVVTNRDLASNNNLRTLSASANATVSGTVSLNGGIVFAPAGGTTLTVSGIVQDGADATPNARHDIRASGAGTVVLSAAETNTGDAFVDSGTLLLPAGASLASGSISVLTGGAFVANGTIRSDAKIYTAGQVLFRGNTGSVSSALSLGTLEVDSGGSVTIAHSTVTAKPVVVSVGAVSFLGDFSGKIDLTNNQLITTNDQDTVRQQLLATNILTTTAGGTIGYKDTGDGHTQLQFTLPGDADLSGKVDIADLGSLASHWQQTAFWSGGDFNYDNIVNIADLGMLASNWQGTISFNAALAQVAAEYSSSVPEPTMVGLAAVGLLAARRRRA